MHAVLPLGWLDLPTTPLCWHCFSNRGTVTWNSEFNRANSPKRWVFNWDLSQSWFTEWLQHCLCQHEGGKDREEHIHSGDWLYFYHVKVCLNYTLKAINYRIKVPRNTMGSVTWYKHLKNLGSILRLLYIKEEWWLWFRNAWPVLAGRAV